MRDGLNLPTQNVYCPNCLEHFIADGAEHECYKCGFKFDLRDRSLLGVVVKEPGLKARVQFILDNNEVIQKLVEGHFEGIYWGHIAGIDGLYLYCNEDGKRLPECLPNVEFPGEDIIMGTVIVAKAGDDGEHVTLTKQEAAATIFSLDSRAYGK